MTLRAPIRVLIVDDSAFARKVIREVLLASPDIEIVGFARDGLDALEKIGELTPDVITLDLVMPNLDGIGVLEVLAQSEAEDRPRVVVVSKTGAESDLALRALEMGAAELLVKPTALATERLYELRTELLLKVKSAAAAKPGRALGAKLAPLTGPSVSARKLLVIGTSTGGPQALARLIPMLPASFPLPVAVALHIPAGYTDALARRLDEASALEVVEAYDGVPLEPGRVVIARGGFHLKFERAGTALHGLLTRLPSSTAHFPSVDVLFESAAEHAGVGTVGIVLTGMGDDGLRGARMIKRMGGVMLTEAASSSVVYGMPRAVHEAGLSDASAPLDELPKRLLGYL